MSSVHPHGEPQTQKQKTAKFKEEEKSQFQSFSFIFNKCIYICCWELTEKRKKIKKYFIWLLDIYRDVAQPGSAQVSGTWGREFKSPHPDLQMSIHPTL